MTDVQKLIERIRAHAHNLRELGYSYPAASMDEVPAALEAQAAEIAELREALKPFAEIAKELNDGIPDDGKSTWDWAVPYAGDLRRARAKFEGSGA
jgi:hypothetical protein